MRRLFGLPGSAIRQDVLAATEVGARPSDDDFAARPTYREAKISMNGTEGGWAVSGGGAGEPTSPSVASTPQRASGAGAIRVIVSTISCRSVRGGVLRIKDRVRMRLRPGHPLVPQIPPTREDFRESCDDSFSATLGFFANYSAEDADSATANLACFDWIAAAPRRRNSRLRLRSPILLGRDSNLASAVCGRNSCWDYLRPWQTCGLQMDAGTPASLRKGALEALARQLGFSPTPGRSDIGAHLGVKGLGHSVLSVDPSSKEPAINILVRMGNLGETAKFAKWRLPLSPCEG